MEQAQLIGYGIIALSTILGFVVTVLKFVQPINELRIVIQKLNDNIDALSKDSEFQNNRLNRHSEQIEKLKSRVSTLETSMKFYHDKS